MNSWIHITLITVWLVFATVFTYAQSSNIFLDREYWKTQPSLEDIKVKMEEGNDPTQLNSNSFDPATYAIMEELPNETLQYLIDLEGNGKDKLTHDGRTYIFWAAYAGNLSLVKSLVEQGAKTDIVDDHGYSLLNFAATTGQTDVELYDFLLANGSDLSETNHDGANALLLLIPHLTDFTLVDYFTEKGADLNAKDDNGNGVFNYMARSGNKEMLDKLIEKGVDYQGLNAIGGNAMLFASQGNRGSSIPPLSFFEYLEGLGIEPNVTTNESATPLHSLASRAENTEVISYFIDKGVDVDQANKEGNTPLMYAAAYNDPPIVEFFIEKANDINAYNEGGETALTRAVDNNWAKVVDLLISKGADINVKDKKGNTLAYYLIQSYYPNYMSDFDEKLSKLEEEGLDLTVTQAEGNTLFHLAAEKNNLDLLKKVHALGVDVNQQNKEGTTTLQIAAMKATNDDILKYLIEIGADVEVVTAFDETVYDLASENELLQENGTSIDFLKNE
ncbi:MAG: ankyrin repeat domain-containing protein [Bacteroidota bacterium]